MSIEPAATFTFINATPRHPHAQEISSHTDTKAAVRAHAAKASANARLAALHKRAAQRFHRAGQGRGVFVVNTTETDAIQQQSYQDRDAAISLYAGRLLGGPIPLAQLDAATLGHFLGRFSTIRHAERPWVELVMAQMGSAAQPSMITRALQANATALCANDLNRPDFRIYATQHYLAAITQLRNMLESSNWSEPTVLHTSMILTLYECITGRNSAVKNVHVGGVAQLVQRKHPRDFANGLEHKTFRYFRVNMLMRSLADQQPTFLAEREWKTAPFEGDGPPKTVLDWLVDILLDLPGVLDAAKALKDRSRSQYSLISGALSLASWVRSLIWDLEKWKEDHIWPYAMCSTSTPCPSLRCLGLLGLIDFVINTPTKHVTALGEAFNCYSAAHLILARIAHALARKSTLIGLLVQPPHTVHELGKAIILVSTQQIFSEDVGMGTLLLAGFALKVMSTTTEGMEKALSDEATALLSEINRIFANRFNIRCMV